MRICRSHPCTRVPSRMKTSVDKGTQLTFPTAFAISRKAFLASSAPTHSMRVHEYEGSNFLSSKNLQRVVSEVIRTVQSKDVIKLNFGYCLDTVE